MLPASARPGHLRALLRHARSAAARQARPTSRSRCTSSPTRSAKRGMVVLISRSARRSRARDSRPASTSSSAAPTSSCSTCSIRTRSSFRSSARRGSRISRPSEEVMAVPAVVREHYLEAIGALIDRYKRELGAAGIDYHLLTTDQPLELALLAYLSTRAAWTLLMSFLSPLFLLGALAAAVPIVLHLLKRRAGGAVRFSAVRLLRQRAGRAHAAAGICASCCCWRCASRRCCCSRSRSRVRSLPPARASAISELTVVALDTSLSMSAPGQFDKARDRGDGGDRRRRRPISVGAGHLRRRRRGRGAAIGRSRPGPIGGRSTRRAGLRRHALPGRAQCGRRAVRRPQRRARRRDRRAGQRLGDRRRRPPAGRRRSRGRRRRCAAAEPRGRRRAHVRRPDHCDGPERRG